MYLTSHINHHRESKKNRIYDSFLSSELEDNDIYKNLSPIFNDNNTKKFGNLKLSKLNFMIDQMNKT